jgi:hypothetical protein
MSMTSSMPGRPVPQPLAAPQPEVRAAVRDLLHRSPAYHKLPPTTQQQVARDTALVADALVANGDPSMRSVSARPFADDNKEASFKDRQATVDAIGKEPFRAGAAREGAAVAGEFIKQVNFVAFVSGLIDGVFNSIVTSNIQQMEAYAKMVSDVSKSLNDFRDENTTQDQGQDHLLEQFPDVFDLGTDSFGGGNTPKLMLKDDVDQDAALTRVNDALGSYAEGGIQSIDVNDPEAQATLIKAARSHIATARQQLLATMVMMGLSRIVVTNGKISAKIMYDFNASSQRNVSRSAQAMEFARNAEGNLQILTDGEEENETKSKRVGTKEGTYDGGFASGSGTYKGNYDSDYYTKGKYKYAQRPQMTAMSIAADQQSDVLTARAQLAGQVDVNFKTDYLPLEKMASPGMIEAIQMRSKPVDQNRPVYKPTEAQPVPAPATQPAAAR